MELDKHYLYLLVNLGALCIPFLFSFHKKLQFHKVWKAYFPANLISITPFLVWDYYFTKWEFWGFNPDYLSGYYLFNLPLEEVLFFLCIPYACVFTWHCLNVLWFHKRDFKLAAWVFPISILSAIFMAVNFFQQWYTSFTFMFLAGLIASIWYLKIKWFGNFLICYAILLIPFLIVNGILTGTGPDAPVVWYNDNYNLSTRIASIPIEDVFYGMSLILLNTILFELFKKKELDIKV